MRYVKLGLGFLLAAFFVFAGVNHFRDSAFFLKLMPDYIPEAWHWPAVWASGVAEISLGALLLVPVTRRLAAWGLIALLIAVFPANIYAYQHSREIFPNLDPALHFWRLPLQGVLIVWAWWYTRPDANQNAAPNANEPNSDISVA